MKKTLTLLTAVIVSLTGALEAQIPSGTKDVSDNKPPEWKNELHRTINFTLRPNQWTGYVLGNSEENAFYYVEITPSGDTEKGKSIKYKIQTEQKPGDPMRDVLRIIQTDTTTRIPTSCVVRVFKIESSN